MTIISISRGSYSMGKAVAELTAKRLECECISRDVLLEASGQFNIPELRLERAFTDAPSILERITHGRQRYVAYIQSALTRHLCAGNVVYHGLAGGVLLRPLDHVLKVRIIAGLDYRVSLVMKRDGLTHREATSTIKRLDRERRRWTKSLYGVDPNDPALYDLMISVPRYEVEEAAELICRSSALPQFKSTEDRKRELQDLALACQVKAALVAKHPDVTVVSRYGNVVVYCSTKEGRSRRLREQLADLEKTISEINNIEVHAGVKPPVEAV